MTTFVVIIPEETLQAFTHPAIDLRTRQLIELEAEPAPVQLGLFEPLPATFEPLPDQFSE